MFGGPPAVANNFKAFPFFLHWPDFTADGATHIIALHSFTTDWLGDSVPSVVSHNARRSESLVVVPIIPPPLTDNIPEWTVANVSSVLRANAPFTEEFITFVAQQHIDGVAMLSNSVGFDRRFESQPVGLVTRFVQFMQALRTRFDRRVVPFGTRSAAAQRFRVQVSTSMSATLLELLVRQGDTIDELQITTYLQKTPVFGGNPQLDATMMQDRPEGDVVCQVDLRQCQLMTSGPSQTFGPQSMMPTSTTQTQIGIVLNFECASVLYHQKVTNRDTLGIAAHALPGHRPRTLALPSCPGTTLIVSTHRAPTIVHWDGYVPCGWSREVHALLPRKQRLAIREMFFIRSLRRDNVLAKLDFHIFTRLATLVMESEFVFPLRLYPGRPEFVTEIEVAREKHLRE